jgi:hypothetical protein
MARFKDVNFVPLELGNLKILPAIMPESMTDPGL